jgi:hypothetical protein
MILLAYQHDGLVRPAGKRARARKISGKVIDAQTGEPIPNALCAVAGYGMGYSRSGSYSEFFSESDGNVMISGTFPMIIRPPSLFVFKKGYVAWNNNSIFPGYYSDRRKDFKWQDGYIFKLEKWNESYSHKEHHIFIMSSFPQDHGIYKGKLKKAIEFEIKD